MITSQWITIVAAGSILVTWAISWGVGPRARVTHRIFAVINVQAVAAVLLTFAGDSLALSLLLAVIILGAVGWMIRAGSLPRTDDKSPA